MIEFPDYCKWENTSLFLGPAVSCRQEMWWAALTVLPQVYGAQFGANPDGRNNQIVLITTEPAPTAPPVAGAATTPATPPAGAGQRGGGQRGGRGSGPALLDILVVGR